MQPDKQREFSTPTHEQDSSQSRSLPDFYNHLALPTTNQYIPPVNTTTSTTTASGLIPMTGSPGPSAPAILNQSFNTPQSKSRAFTRASAVNEHTNTNYYMTMGQTMAANYSSNMDPFAFPASAESYTCGRNNTSAIGGQPQVPYANMDPTMDFVDDTTAATTVPLPTNNMNYNMTMEQTNDIVMNDPVDNEVYAFENTFDTLQNTKELNVANYTTANAMPENMYTHQDRARAVQDTVMTNYNTLEAPANEYTSGPIVESAQDTATNSASLESNVVNPPGSAAKSRVNKSPTKKKRTQSPLEQLKYGFEWNKPSPELGCDGSRALRSRETRVKAAGSFQDTKPIVSAATVSPPGPEKEAAADSQGTKQDLPLDIIDVPDDVARPIKPLKSAGKGKAKQPTKKKTSKASQASQASKASQATVTADAADTIKPESDLIDIDSIETTIATTSIEQGATGQIQHKVAAPPAPSPLAPKKGSRSTRKATRATTNPLDPVASTSDPAASTSDPVASTSDHFAFTSDLVASTSAPITAASVSNEPTETPVVNMPQQTITQGTKRRSAAKFINCNESTLANQAQNLVDSKQPRPKRARNKLSPPVVAPVLEELPTKEELPVIVDLVSMNDVPSVQGLSIVQGKPSEPLVEDTPLVEDAPSVEDMQLVEDTPLAEDSQIVEDTQLVESVPVKEDVATVQDLPAVGSSPTEEIIVVQATETPATSKRKSQQKKGKKSTNTSGARATPRPKRKCTTASINYGDEAKEVQPENTSTQLTIGEQDTQQQNDMLEATSSQINLIDIQPTELPIAEEQNIEQVSGSKVKSDRKIRFPRTKRTRIEEAKNGQEGVPATEIMIGEQQINAEQLTIVTDGCSSRCKRNAKTAQVDIEEEKNAQVNITTTETPNNEQQMEGVQLADVSSSKSSAKRPRRAKEPKVQHNEEGEDLLQAIHPTTDLQIIGQQTDVGQSTGTPTKRRRIVGRKTNTTEAELKQSDIIAPTSTKRSAKGKEREVITVDAEETPPVAPVAPVGEPVTEKRGRSRAKAPVTPKPRASRRQPSVKATEAKAVPATESDYRELDEVEVRETEIASSSKIQPIIVETDEQEGEEETTEKMKDTEEEKEQDEGIKFLLTNKNSPLATADLRTLIPQWFNALSAKDREELVQLAPEPDQVKKKGKVVDLKPEFESPSNNFFWEAVDQYQDILSIGGFAKKPESSKKAEPKESSFKDDNYEAYWGERLKRDKAAKEKALKAAASGSGSRRGGKAGRGRGKGRKSA